jgi:RNA polymerase sigma-70 factor, ECF subfamily
VHDDSNLLRRARSRDQDALAEIHDRYYPAIYRYLAFRVSDSQTAEDLVSEVFVRFLNAVSDASNPPNTLRGWLYGAASNVLKEHYRQQGRVDLSELGDALPDTASAAPESSVMNKERRAELRSALGDLTDDQQNVLALRFGFGLPIKEVAEVVNKSEGSVKMLQVRAIMNLTKRLSTGGDVS